MYACTERLAESPASSVETGHPCSLPARSQSARSTPLIASSMKPPVWPRTRIVEYIPVPESLNRGTIPAEVLAFKHPCKNIDNHRRRNSRSNRSRASPHPTVPSSSVTLTRVVSMNSE